MLDDIAASRGWLVGFGVATSVAGIITVAWPGRTIVVVAVLVGLHLFVAGVYRLVIAASAGGEAHRAWWVLMGLTSVAVGILCLKDVFQTIAALTLILGITWVVQGLTEFFTGITGGPPHPGWAVVQGVLGFVAGVVVLTYPVSSVVTLAWVLGGWLTVYGGVLVAGALSPGDVTSAG